MDQEIFTNLHMHHFSFKIYLILKFRKVEKLEHLTFKFFVKTLGRRAENILVTRVKYL